MCLSSVGQIIFGVVLLVVTGLTAVALFTPGWTYYEIVNPAAHPLEHLKNTTQGIMPWDCAKSTASAKCDDWWNAQPGWMKTVAVCMWLALIAEIITLIYNLITFFACCCKSCLMTPLAILSSICTVLLTIAVITFGVNAKDVPLYNWHFQDAWNGTYQADIGYSYYLALGALLLMAADTVLAFITACLGTMCC